MPADIASSIRPRFLVALGLEAATHEGLEPERIWVLLTGAGCSVTAMSASSNVPRAAANPVRVVDSPATDHRCA
jgi:hypothetical protein